MRPARMLLGAALALALAGPLRAGEVVILEGSVQTDGAEVRCKPGTENTVYVTQKLPRGAAVKVVKKLDDGWLEIVPPDGSYSWVNMRHLSRATDDPRIWVLTAEGAPVLVGSAVKEGKPNVVGTTLKRGAQVVAMGGPWNSEDGDGLWLPVMPPPGEYRYIREKDVAPVRAPPPAGTTTVAHPTPAGTLPDVGAGQRGALPPAGHDLPPASKDVHVGGSAAPVDVDPLLQQAEHLEHSGDRAGAAKLYDQLGNKYANTDHNAAVQYYSHAGWLRQPQSAVPRPATQAETLYQRARQAEQAGNRAEAIRCYEQLGDMYRENYSVSMPYYNRAACLRQGQAPPPAASVAKSPPAAAAPPPNASPAGGVVSNLTPLIGHLRETGTTIGGQAAYVLGSPQGGVVAYLVPQPGVRLERYVNQNVQVYGKDIPQRDVQGRVLTVSVVQSLSGP